jgi:hypothetical protein
VFANFEKVSVLTINGFGPALIDENAQSLTRVKAAWARRW